MGAVRTVADVLRQPHRPEHTLGYLTGPEPTYTTHGQLRERALRVLGMLQDRGVEPGEFVGLVTTDIQVFVESFWACLLGGAIPLPVSAGTAPEHQRKVLRVMKLFGDRFLIIDRSGWARLAEFASGDGLQERMAALEPRVMWSEDILRAAAEGLDGRPHDARPEDVAYVQFSSGSTRAPKGICLTHRNLLANMESITRAIELQPEDRPIAWMPLTHDMGLIGGHLTALYRSTSHTIIPTERFVRRPLTWLQHASELRSTITTAPNFAYQHTLRAYRPERFEGCDLSALRVIFNGAEPIVYDLARRFLETFEAHGLRPAAMFPVYGLAEASLAVTTPPLMSGLRRTAVDRTQLGLGDRAVPPAADKDRLDLVPVGSPVHRTDVRIGDGTAPDGTVGPIWIRGDNVTTRVRTDDGESSPQVDGWYDTGDLGFFKDGDLHVCGRVKEMAIVNGQNVFPHDIEEVALAVDGLERGKVVAIGVRDPETDREVLGVFVQWRKGAEAFAPVAQAIREVVTRRTGVQASIVHPVPAIPKTTSGKVQRVQLARDYECGRLS